MHKNNDTQTRPAILILGIGNILMQDEGIGVRVIEAIEKMSLSADIELCDGGTAGADLIDILADRTKVVIIDAINADVAPGTILKLKAEEVVRNDSPVSLHEIGLSETLYMTKQLGCEPKEVVIFGVKPAIVDCGLEMTPAIAALVPTLAQLALAEANL